jgi:hypothetical protein
MYVWEDSGDWSFRFEAECIDKNDYRDENGNLELGRLNSDIKKVKKDLGDYAKGYQVDDARYFTIAYGIAPGQQCNYPNCDFLDFCYEIYYVEVGGNGITAEIVDYGAAELNTQPGSRTGLPSCNWKIPYAPNLLSWPSYASDPDSDFDLNAFIDAQLLNINKPFMSKFNANIQAGEYSFVHRGKCKDFDDGPTSKKFDKFIEDQKKKNR